MIKVDGTAMVLLCDCHRGKPHQMGRVEHAVLTIIARSGGDHHVVRVPLDKLRGIGLELVETAHRSTWPTVE